MGKYYFDIIAKPATNLRRCAFADQLILVFACIIYYYLYSSLLNRRYVYIVIFTLTHIYIDQL